VQDILGNAFKEKQGDRDKYWIDKRKSQPCALLMHRTTGNGRVLLPQTTPWGRTTP